MSAATGNRCGHSPKRPSFRPAHPIRKGKGGLPRILSFAAEHAKAWYRHPAKCPPLQRARRAIRSERREALQIVIETILSHLDLASLCLGTPTLDHGFIDIDMKTLVATAGIGQRRIEQAIVLLKEASFLEVSQPRSQNEQGDYCGCRAIRVVTETLFDWIGLGPMLQQERARASERLRHRAQKASKKLSGLMRRIKKRFKPPEGNPTQHFAPRHDPNREKMTLTWIRKWGEFTLSRKNPEDAQR